MVGAWKMRISRASAAAQHEAHAVKKTRLQLLIEDTEIQVLAAIKSIDAGYGATAVAELNGAKLMVERLKFEEQAMRRSGVVLRLGT
jgi:hypothetical protein